MTAAPLLHGRPDDAALTDHLLAPLSSRPPSWRALWVAAIGLTLLLAGTVGYTVARGIGVWGNNIPVAWGFAITNFVWWIGIGHAGTFISAFLLLLDQRWRSSINRVAEAMTIFALVNAGLFPLLHLGRPWFFYWLVPYPSRMGVWPNFKSALPWDIAAVATYFSVSLLFWYLGMLPDLATARDRLTGRLRRRIYGLFALGWRGAGAHWRRHRVAMLLLAGLAAPLVVSVHSVVSLDFSIAQLPGWHSTIFPPYFVVGAIYSGFAMLLVLVIPTRSAYQLHDVITDRHLANMAKMLLTTGVLMAYFYTVELAMAWYSGDRFDRYVAFVQRPFGDYAALYWTMMALNVLTPQLFWSRRARTDTRLLFLAGVAILAGMWLERYLIITTSLSRDFLPSSWHPFSPTWVDLGLLAGTAGLFLLCFLVFFRFVPSVAIYEVKKVAAEERDA